MRWVVSGLLSVAVAGATAGTFEFDGDYAGVRDLARNLPRNCRPTEIRGRIENGNVKLTLVYNGSTLTGTIGADGRLTLRGATVGYQYTFEGKAAGDVLSGTWTTMPGDCFGTWSVRRR